MRCVSADHYFSAEPDAPSDYRRVEFEVAGITYRLATAGGVFSADRLDPGTAVLLRKAPLPGPDTTRALLDLGCGYGPIAAVLARNAPRATVYAVDVNRRALRLVRENAAALGLADRVNAVTPDEVPAGVRFAGIWSNPPIRVGNAPRQPEGVPRAAGRRKTGRRTALASGEWLTTGRQRTERSGVRGQAAGTRRHSGVCRRGGGCVHAAGRPRALRRCLVPRRGRRQGRTGRTERRWQDDPAADGGRRHSGDDGDSRALRRLGRHAPVHRDDRRRAYRW